MGIQWMVCWWVLVHCGPGTALGRVFPNLRIMHKYGNLPLCKQLSFDSLLLSPFIQKKIFPWEHENIKNWGAPPA
jgi:hypothetical protein